jgi:hypothetical protein
MSFYVAGASSAVGGIGLLLAWNRYDRGPDDINDLDEPGAALYAVMRPTVGPQLCKAMSKHPIKIPEANCPDYPDGYSPDGGRDLIAQLNIKPSGVLGPIVEVTFDLFDGSEHVYAAAPKDETFRVELADNSLLPAEIRFLERLEVQAWEDPLEGWASLIGRDPPAKQLWSQLMTPNQPVNWW